MAQAEAEAEAEGRREGLRARAAILSLMNYSGTKVDLRGAPGCRLPRARLAPQALAPYPGSYSEGEGRRPESLLSPFVLNFIHSFL